MACLLLLLCSLWAQPPKPATPPPDEPPEEEVTAKEKEYAFNPLQAEKEIKVGHFYEKKKAWKAAALRFEEATKWNPGSSEAWLLLGEAREKMHDNKAAREAYTKYLEIAADAKNAPEIKKKLESLK